MHKLLKTTHSGVATLTAFRKVNFWHISVGELRRELYFLQNKSCIQSIQLQFPPPSVRRLLLKLTEIHNYQINSSMKEHRWESCWRKKLLWWLLSVTKATSKIHMPPWMTRLSPFQGLYITDQGILHIFHKLGIFFLFSFHLINSEVYAVVYHFGFLLHKCGC